MALCKSGYLYRIFRFLSGRLPFLFFQRWLHCRLWFKKRCQPGPMFFFHLAVVIETDGMQNIQQYTEFFYTCRDSGVLFSFLRFMHVKRRRGAGSRDVTGNASCSTTVGMLRNMVSAGIINSLGIFRGEANVA